ncbi:MAG TPA: sulfotransferase [Gemmataceae bacterium]|nr:sulfotransferase [Gemmataceae bacterium]
MRLLVRNRFAVHWRYWYIAAIITLISILHTLLRLFQTLRYGRQLARTKIRHAPIFIIGHWRTGTTLLHELMILDDRHNYPTTYECLSPNHFLLTEKFFSQWMRFLLPAHRPMDNMAAGWDRPQEDEFALCMLGQPSPYLTVAFPNHGPVFPEYLDLEGLSPRALAGWKKTFLGFLQQITARDSRRLVLKSPPHTARIKVLLEMFPNARFIHIVRSPYVIFPSTVHLWKSLYRNHGLQEPNYQGLEEYVFTTFLHLYEKLEEGKKLVDKSRFYELRYEDLIADPIHQMRALFDHLELGEFERVLPKLDDYLRSVEGYETNKYEITPEMRSKIAQRWGPVIRRYGYERGGK